MALKIALISLVGLLVDIVFIRTEYEGQMIKATVLKALASLFFVILGVVCYMEKSSPFGLLVLIGLVLGMLGDIFLNMRNCVKGALSMKIFAVGILFFLSGHFLYIASLISLSSKAVPLALGFALVLSCASIPPLMKRITAPTRALKIFGYVYLVVVIAMFSSSLSVMIHNGGGVCGILFTIGALLFVVSDFIMIYYSFGKKIKPLRAVNLLSYYCGQLLIALTILMVK